MKTIMENFRQFNKKLLSESAMTSVGMGLKIGHQSGLRQDNNRKFAKGYYDLQDQFTELYRKLEEVERYECSTDIQLTAGDLKLEFEGVLVTGPMGAGRAMRKIALEFAKAYGREDKRRDPRNCGRDASLASRRAPRPSRLAHVRFITHIETGDRNSAHIITGGKYGTAPVLSIPALMAACDFMANEMRIKGDKYRHSH